MPRPKRTIPPDLNIPSPVVDVATMERPQARLRHPVPSVNDAVVQALQHLTEAVNRQTDVFDALRAELQKRTDTPSVAPYNSQSFRERTFGKG